MHQARIEAWGSAPKYLSVPDLPDPGPNEERIKVEAVGIHQVVRSRASGKHYSSGSLPHIPGVDGVGTRVSDNKKVYFFSFGTGTLSEEINMPKTMVYELGDGFREEDVVKVAGMVNPTMSSWMSFKQRTKDLPKGFTVLILGATTASGKIAIQIARTLGARKVIGAARSTDGMEKLNLDRRVIIAENVKETDFSDLDDVDVVLDYVYGPLTLHLFDSLKTPKPVHYVQIGSVSGQMEISIPGALLRSKDLTLRGSGPGSWRMVDYVEILPEMLKMVGGLKVEEGGVRTAKLEDVESVWEEDGKGRLVIVT